MKPDAGIAQGEGALATKRPGEGAGFRPQVETWVSYYGLGLSPAPAHDPMVAMARKALEARYPGRAA